MGEAEDVVHEEQHVLTLVAEIFGDGEPREADAGAGARWLVHLAIHQRAFRAFHRALARVLVHARIDHLVVEVIALARALAHAGEHRVAAMRLGDVVDELHDQHGLADAGAAEQADLAAFGVRREQVDNLDAGDKDLGLGGLIDIGGSGRVDRPLLGSVDGAGLVDRLAHHVHDAPERLVADGDGDRLAGVHHLLAAHQTFGRIHGDGAHGILAEMLGDFEHEAVAVILRLERIQDLRQLIFELHVDHGAHDLAHMAHRAFIGRDLRLLLLGLCDHGGLLCHVFVPSRLTND